MAQGAANQKAPQAPSPASRSHPRNPQQLSLGPLSLPNGQMTKLKQFSNEFDVLFQGKTIHGLGEYRPTHAEEHSSRGTLGKDEFYLEVVAQKQGLIGWVARDFLIRLVGPIL